MLRGAVVVLAAALCLFAPPARAADDTPEPRPGSDTISLTLWTLALRPWFNSYMEGRIGAFEKANPGVRVEWVDVPYDALDRKLIAAAAAGRAPDVVNMSDMNFARFVSLGAFRDLTSDLPGNANERYLPAALALCRFEDAASGSSRLLGLPWYVNTQTLLANQPLLELGLGTEWRAALATDWTGLIALAPEFKARTGKFLFSQPMGDESEIPQMLLSHGLPPLREGPQGGVVANLANPETSAYLRLWVDLYRSGGMPREAATKGHAHLTEMYQQGELALANTGPNFLKRIKDAAPQIYEATTVLPGMTGRLGRGHIPVMVLAVTTQTKHPREAASLAWFLTSDESQLEFCTLATILPSTMNALSDPFFAPPSPEALAGPEGKVLLARSVTARSLGSAVAFTCTLESWPDLRRIFQDRFKRVLLDGDDLDRTLLIIEREWNAVLLAAPRASITSVPRPEAVPLPDRSGVDSSR